VCERAGVARATFYHYFGSKDHVLGEVLVHWGRDRMEELRQHPPAGRTPLERVVATLRWVMDGVLRDPNLIRAHIQSLVTPAGVAETQRQLSSLLADYLEAGVGPSARLDVASLSMVLKHVFFSSLVNMTAGRTTAETAMADLTTTAKLLLEPASACGTNRALTGEKRAGGQQRLRRTTRQ
jgi:AcrR family transcriptional regulator